MYSGQERSKKRIVIPSLSIISAAFSLPNESFGYVWDFSSLVLPGRPCACDAVREEVDKIILPQTSNHIWRPWRVARSRILSLSMCCDRQATFTLMFYVDQRGSAVVWGQKVCFHWKENESYFCNRCRCSITSERRALVSFSNRETGVCFFTGSNRRHLLIRWITD